MINRIVCIFIAGVQKGLAVRGKQNFDTDKYAFKLWIDEDAQLDDLELRVRDLVESHLQYDQARQQMSLSEVVVTVVVGAGGVSYARFRAWL